MWIFQRGVTQLIKYNLAFISTEILNKYILNYNVVLIIFEDMLSVTNYKISCKTFSITVFTYIFIY